MMTKWMILFDAIVVIIAVSAAFLFVQSYNQQMTSQNQNEIKIGAIAPFTGSFALQGERIRNGMDLAKEEILRDDNTKSINIIYEDACLPKDAVPAFRKLITADSISILGGSFCLIGFVPLITIAEENNIIIFNTAANPDMVLNNSAVFSTNIAIRDDAQNLARFARENLSAKSAAIIYYVTPFGQDYSKHFDLYFKEFGGNVVSNEQTDLSATDFRTELTKMKKSNPDVIFVVHLANPLGTLLKQARELGITSTIISMSEAEDPNVLSTAGNAADGFIISSSEPAIKTEKVKQFEEDYKKKFNTLPDVLAANAYDALKIQISVYETCKGETSCMKNELHKIKDYDGASGKITINPDGSTNKPFIIKIVRNGTFVRYNP